MFSWPIVIVIATYVSGNFLRLETVVVQVIDLYNKIGLKAVLNSVEVAWSLPNVAGV